MYNTSRPMCLFRDDYDFEQGDYKDTKVTTPSGSEVSQREFSDGSTEVDFGPMGGKVRYNSNGDECG